MKPILIRIFWYTVGVMMALALLTPAGFIYYYLATGGDQEATRVVRQGRHHEQPQVPQWSRDGRLVVFSHKQTVYAVEPDGSGLREVAGHRGGDELDAAQSPSISPDGTRVTYTAFKHDRWWLPWIEHHSWEIVTSALDGSDRRKLTDRGLGFAFNLMPSWSPASRIAFVSRSTGPGDREVLTMGADGSDVRRLAPGVVAKISPLVWSPDGGRLAFIAREPDSPDGAWRDPVTKKLYPERDVLYTIGADGTGLTRIGNAAGTPSWSPDGGRIAFARSDGDTHVAIVTADPDGANEQTVFESSEVRSTGITEPTFNVSWSPDGTAIAITGLRVPHSKAPWCETQAVSIVRADGIGPPRLISAIWLTPAGVSWSPDGSLIAVHYPDAGSPGAALQMMAPVALPEQDESWYRWGEGEMGRDATPRPTPPLSQTQPSPPQPAPTPPSMLSVMHEPSTQSTAACAVDSDASCEPRDVRGFGLFSAGDGAAGPEPVAAPSVEDVLDRGLLMLDASPAHIVIRGTAQGNTVRCDWRGIARTARQREEATWTTSDTPGPPWSHLIEGLIGIALRTDNGASPG